MNIVLESLFLRRPRINYVSPPVCPIVPSGASGSSLSGSVSLTLQEICPPEPPQLFAKQSFLYWQPLPNLGNCTGCEGTCGKPSGCAPQQEICFSIYKAVDPSHPTGAYNLTQACVPPMTAVCCTPGCYIANGVDENGVEVVVAQPVCGDGSVPILVPMPVAAGIATYNLFRADTYIQQYGLVLSDFFGEAYEVCGCFGVYPQSECAICLGAMYSEVFVATGGVSQSLVWSLLSGAVPTGLTLHVGPSTTGLLLSGVPTVPGRFTFTVVATDISGAEAIATFTLDVVGITTASLPDYTVGVPYSTQLTGSGVGGPYVFGLINSALPNGLTFTNTGLISGTPALPVGGSNPLEFTIQDQSVINCPASGVCNTLLSLNQAHFPYDTFETYSAYDQLSGLNGGVNWSGAYVDRNTQFPVVIAYDSYEEDTNGAPLLGLGGGGGWLGVYSDHTTPFPSLLVDDTFESYTNGVALDGLNGGANVGGSWNGAYVNH